MMRIGSCLLAGLLLSTTLAHARTSATSDTSWGDLQPGPHAVGFRTSIVLDHGRRYSTTFDDGATYGSDGKAPRPILLNVWYPADGQDAPAVMAYGRYFDIGSDDPAVDRWARALSAYAADVACTEMLDKPVAELDPREAAVWQRFLDLPTRARSDATPRDGPYPSLVYHSGAGSSYEDNSVFCEYLASHGFVVLGSAYPAADGSSFGIDSRDGSVRDMEFLAQHARSLPFADWNRLAFGGHSAGAQVCMRALMRPDCPADTVFLLDTTIDYYSPDIPTFEYLTAPVLEHREMFTRPMLVTAGPEAPFQLCDTLSGADRTYLTLPELDHNEFIAQGVHRLRTQAWLHAARGDADGGNATRALDVNRLYAALCEAIRCYLDAELSDDRAAFDALCERYAPNALGGTEPCVEFAPPGTTAAPAYDPASGRAPTPRQLQALLTGSGAAGLVEALAAHLDTEPRSPLYTSSMAMGSALYDLVLGDRLDEARTLHTWLAAHDLDGVGTLRFLAYMCLLTERPDRARRLLDVALDIAPDDPRTLEELRKLDANS